MSVNQPILPILFSGPCLPSSLSEVVGQAVGAGSVCWQDVAGAGVFDSARAAQIVAEAVAWIEDHYRPSVVEADEAVAVDEARLRSSTDAWVWAEEFAKVCPTVSFGLMLGWFANAIETGREAAR